MKTDQTNVQTIGLAAAATVIIMWLLGFFAPDLMATAPVGLEAAITGVVVVITGWLLPKDKFIKGTGNG
jgi:hypothetical protein